MSTQTASTAAQTVSVQPIISRNVKVLLASCDWDQSDLAMAVGLSEPQVSRKMKHKGSSWTPDDLAVMADVFTSRLGFTIAAGWFFLNVDELIGQNRKKMNASDLQVIPGGDEGGQGRIAHLHLVPS